MQSRVWSSYKKFQGIKTQEQKLLCSLPQEFSLRNIISHRCNNSPYISQGKYTRLKVKLTHLDQLTQNIQPVMDSPQLVLCPSQHVVKCLSYLLLVIRFWMYVFMSLRQPNDLSASLLFTGNTAFTLRSCVIMSIWSFLMTWNALYVLSVNTSFPVYSSLLW